MPIYKYTVKRKTIDIKKQLEDYEEESLLSCQERLDTKPIKRNQIPDQKKLLKTCSETPPGEKYSKIMLKIKQIINNNEV